MLSQLFMAKSAFFSYQRKMQVISNNIANAQTIGYKKNRMEMESIFPLVLERAYSEFDESSGGISAKRKKYMEYGQGVRIVDISKDFSGGTIEITNQQMDLAIEKGCSSFVCLTVPWRMVVLAICTWTLKEMFLIQMGIL
jgi:flagellar basal-body rod protein FlgG